jgi:hypothetical protein
MRSILSVGGLVLLSLSTLLAYGSDIESAKSAVQGALNWEKRWYGSHWGQQCLDRAAAVHLRIYTVRRQDSFTVGYLCDTAAPITESVQSFEAYVDGTGIFFSGLLGSRARADLSDGESNPQCTISDDDLKARASRIKKYGQWTTFMKRIHDGALPPTQEVKSYARRSILAWARSSGRAEITSIKIGFVAPEDPYIVVRTEPEGAFRLIVSPSKADLADKNFCGRVFESGRFAGRDNIAKGSRISEAVFDEQSAQ